MIVIVWSEKLIRLFSCPRMNVPTNITKNPINSVIQARKVIWIFIMILWCLKYFVDSFSIFPILWIVSFSCPYYSEKNEMALSNLISFHLNQNILITKKWKYLLIWIETYLFINANIWKYKIASTILKPVKRSIKLLTSLSTFSSMVIICFQVSPYFSKAAKPSRVQNFRFITFNVDNELLSHWLPLQYIILP